MALANKYHTHSFCCLPDFSSNPFTSSLSPKHCYRTHTHAHTHARLCMWKKYMHACMHAGVYLLSYLSRMQAWARPPSAQAVSSAYRWPSRCSLLLAVVTRRAPVRIGGAQIRDGMCIGWISTSGTRGSVHKHEKLRLVELG
jgi:hypothetical protein